MQADSQSRDVLNLVYGYRGDILAGPALLGHSSFQLFSAENYLQDLKIGKKDASRDSPGRQ
jgi:hypothetical protein